MISSFLANIFAFNLINTINIIIFIVVFLFDIKMKAIVRHSEVVIPLARKARECAIGTIGRRPSPQQFCKDREEVMFVTAICMNSL